MFSDKKTSLHRYPPITLQCVQYDIADCMRSALSRLYMSMQYTGDIPCFLGQSFTMQKTKQHYMYITPISELRYIYINRHTVKPVFKGHCNERTTCDQGTLSRNNVLYSPC